MWNRSYRTNHQGEFTKAIPKSTSGDDAQKKVLMHVFEREKETIQRFLLAEVAIRMCLNPGANVKSENLWPGHFFMIQRNSLDSVSVLLLDRPIEC